MSNQAAKDAANPAHDGTPSPIKYISPRTLAMRWAVSRTQVSRICQKACIRRISLSTTGGRNGRICYLLSDVEAFEVSQTF